VTTALVAGALALALVLTWHRRGGGLVPFALAMLAVSPLALVAWVAAEVARHRLPQPGQVRRALRILGLAHLAQGCAIAVRRINRGRSNAVVLVTLTAPGRRPRHLVIKRLLWFGTILGWVGRRFGATRACPAATGTRARTTREVRALLRLHRRGFPVPACLGFSVRDRLLAMEYVPGAPLAPALVRRPGLVGELGRLLARMHATGFALGDANPENMAVDAHGRIVLYDFEHAEGGDHRWYRKGFDLAWVGAFLATDDDRRRLLGAYGPRPGGLTAAIASARLHLHRFSPVIDWYGRGWRVEPAAPFEPGPVVGGAMAVEPRPCP
jgi:hypothetical protein